MTDTEPLLLLIVLTAAAWLVVGLPNRTLVFPALRLGSFPNRPSAGPYLR